MDQANEGRDGRELDFTKRCITEVKLTGLGEILEMEREQGKNFLGFPACATQWWLVSGRVRLGHYGFVFLRCQSENISPLDIEIYSSESRVGNINLGDISVR